MARRPSRPTTGKAAAKPAAPAEQKGFAAWQASATAALEQAHGVKAGTIPARVWKHAYVQGLTPEAAAKEAAVSAFNARPAADRLKGRR
jgi:hypothetical protein